MHPYIILLDKERLSSVGSGWSCACHYKSSFHIMKQAENMIQANSNAKYAYYVSDYTQRMCEMDKKEFSEHVIKTGKFLTIK